MYVLDEKELTGTREFLYDEVAVLTQYVVEPLPFEDIPPIYRIEIWRGFKLIEPLEQRIKVSLEIQTKAEQRFFIPTRLKTHQYFSGSGTLRLDGLPIFLVDDPKLSRLSYVYDFHPIEAKVNGRTTKVLIGLEAIKAQSYFEEKPWECDLFPV